MKKWFTNIDYLLMWLPVTLFFVTVFVILATIPNTQYRCQDGILYAKSENRSIWVTSLDKNDHTYIKCIVPLTQDVP